MKKPLFTTSLMIGSIAALVCLTYLGYRGYLVYCSKYACHKENPSVPYQPIVVPTQMPSEKPVAPVETSVILSYSTSTISKIPGWAPYEVEEWGIKFDCPKEWVVNENFHNNFLREVRITGNGYTVIIDGGGIGWEEVDFKEIKVFSNKEQRNGSEVSSTTNGRTNYFLVYGLVREGKYTSFRLSYDGAASVNAARQTLLKFAGTVVLGPDPLIKTVETTSTPSEVLGWNSYQDDEWKLKFDIPSDWKIVKTLRYDGYYNQDKLDAIRANGNGYLIIVDKGQRDYLINGATASTTIQVNDQEVRATEYIASNSKEKTLESYKYMLAFPIYILNNPYTFSFQMYYQGPLSIIEARDVLMKIVKSLEFIK